MAIYRCDMCYAAPKWKQRSPVEHVEKFTRPTGVNGSALEERERSDSALWSGEGRGQGRQRGNWATTFYETVKGKVISDPCVCVARIVNKPTYCAELYRKFMAFINCSKCLSIIKHLLSRHSSQHKAHGIYNIPLNHFKLVVLIWERSLCQQGHRYPEEHTVLLMEISFHYTGLIAHE